MNLSKDGLARDDADETNASSSDKNAASLQGMAMVDEASNVIQFKA
jgi:hypothetical protein